MKTSRFFSLIFCIATVSSCGYGTITTLPDGSVIVVPKPIVIPAK